MKSSAACKCLRQGLIWTYKQTVWTQIRLVLEVQSDLGPHYLQQRCFKKDLRLTHSRRQSRFASEELMFSSYHMMLRLGVK